MMNSDIVYMVLKNTDFTEGRGPMVFHKLFRTMEAARNYVSRKPGIFGSKQYQDKGLSIEKSEWWNGYSIQEVQIENGISDTEIANLVDRKNYLQNSYDEYVKINKLLEDC